MYKLKIHITKDVLRRSMYCHPRMDGDVGKNCAIALAVRDIFPKAHITDSTLLFNNTFDEEIGLNSDTIKFISDFDDLCNAPEQRLELPEFSFEIEIPDSVINAIGIDEAKQIIEKSQTLELTET